jgi:predicted secreted Zn-dependent protease
MKRLILSILFLLALPCTFAFKQDLSQPVQLDWETHFKGKADTRSPFFALTAMTWKYSYESTVYRNRVAIKLKNEVTIDKSRSWVKFDKIKDPEIRASLLHHEQGHADIQYVLLLEAERVLKNRNYSVTNYKAQISELANQISTYFDTMQRNYDEETEHGSNHKMQARWDDIIQEKIEESRAAMAELQK